MKISILYILSAIASVAIPTSSLSAGERSEESPMKDFVNSEMKMDNQLLQSVLQGRLDAFRSGAVCSPLPNAEFQPTDQNILYAWGIDYICGNGIIEKNQNRVPTDEEIDRMIEHFSAKKLPFMWWTAAKVLETKGFQFGGILTGIALDMAKGIPAKPRVSPDLKIEMIQSKIDVNTFTELAASTFAMSAIAAEQWLGLNASVMEHGEQIHFLARLNGVPVGTATLSVSSDAAGIWNLATLPEHRKAGIGTALVHAALVEAKKRQYNQVMAILMPEGMAWGLFTKLGFKEACEFPFYVYGGSAEEE